MSDSWRWKAKESGPSGTLYEPGNWGDLLKGAWILAVAAALGRRAETLETVDPFAGMPEYPLAPASLKRIESLPNGPLVQILQEWTERNAWPGSTSIARHGAGGRVRASVFDSDEERLQAWGETGSADTLDGEDGYAVAGAHCPGETGLLVIDPYDFLKDWRAQTARIAELGTKTTVLLYIYNRSARGRAHLRRYRDFRNRFDELWGGAPRIFGRVPADGFLPVSHHEMHLLPGPALREDEAARHELFASLEEETLRLEEAIRRTGITGTY